MRRLPGSHPANIRNRSSKHLGWLCGVGHKPVVRSLSNAALEAMATVDKNGKCKCLEAQQELNRRAKKRAKKEAKG